MKEIHCQCRLDLLATFLDFLFGTSVCSIFIIHFSPLGRINKKHLAKLNLKKIIVAISVESDYEWKDKKMSAKSLCQKRNGKKLQVLIQGSTLTVMNFCQFFG